MPMGVRAASNGDTEALKQYRLTHVQAKRPEAGHCVFGYALTDAGPCAEGRTQHALRPRSITSVNELKSAMAEARCKFEADRALGGTAPIIIIIIDGRLAACVSGISWRIRSLRNTSQRADPKHGVLVGSAAACGGTPLSHGRDGRGGRRLGPIHALHVRLALQRHALGIA